MSTVILACTTLRKEVEAAQQKMNTEYPVIYMDQLYHRDPNEMRQHIIETLANLPEEVDTVLVAMGFCGGSWQEVIAPCRMVLPRVDDCVSMMLTVDDSYRFNRKERGHIYIIGPSNRTFSPKQIYQSLMDKYDDEELAEDVFSMWFENYHYLAVVETGIYDCYSEDFLLAMQEDADMFDADMVYRPGSNRMLEKLVSGRWDQQFVVVKPGANIRQGMVLDG